MHIQNKNFCKSQAIMDGLTLSKPFQFINLSIKIFEKRHKIISVAKK